MVLKVAMKDDERMRFTEPFDALGVKLILGEEPSERRGRRSRRVKFSLSPEKVIALETRPHRITIPHIP